jgi:Ca2+-binding EF-hand superfamily protein
MKTCIQTLAIMAIATSFSFAAKAVDWDVAFKKLDTDSNGSVSHAEFMAGPKSVANPTRGETWFKALDTDKSGSLSLEEFKNRASIDESAGKKKGGDEAK